MIPISFLPTYSYMFFQWKTFQICPQDLPILYSTMGSNFRVSWKSRSELYEVFTTASSNWRLIRVEQAVEETVLKKSHINFPSMDIAIITLFMFQLW